ncbi:MAG: methyltransferase domain-containing protein [Candidatus Handelsmanbacteria bacterium]|nr:methyltransferase domain-containing protein [Candidatus Handelsmanbacteria bacterium]
MSSAALERAPLIAGNLYDKYHTRNPVARRLMAGFLGSFDQLLDLRPGEGVLEVGCGEGYLLERLRRRNPKARLAGLDLSREIVRLAFRQVCPGTPLLQASACQLPIGDQSWEVVVACEVLEHLDQPRQALAELARVCRRGCLLSVPREPFWSLANLARGKYLGRLGNTPGHVQQWGRRGFVELAAEFFTVEKVSSPFPWTMIWGTKR